MEFVENKKFTDKFNGDISIEGEYYKKNEHAYNYAMRMNKKEIYQAMEGMFHNLKIRATWQWSQEHSYLNGETLIEI